MIASTLLKDAAARLKAAGIEAPAREARLLLARAAGIDPPVLIGWPETDIPVAAAGRFEAWLNRRLAHEPLSRIVGVREFWSREFRVTPDTLDPRADSETVVTAALGYLARDRPVTIADLGTGTGCLLLALLTERPLAWGIGIDRSAGAVRVARDNAARLGLDRRSAFAVGDWADALAGPIDLIISNPPYIATPEIAALDPAVRMYDPHAALDGGPDGADAYRRLAATLARVLAPAGVLVLELGAGQDQAVRTIIEARGFRSAGLYRDLAGIARAMSVIRW